MNTKKPPQTFYVHIACNDPQDNYAEKVVAMDEKDAAEKVRLPYNRSVYRVEPVRPKLDKRLISTVQRLAKAKVRVSEISWRLEISAYYVKKILSMKPVK